MSPAAAVLEAGGDSCLLRRLSPRRCIGYAALATPPPPVAYQRVAYRFSAWYTR